jgi:hypothetical protein
MPTTDSHAKTPTTEVEDSLTLTEESECGGELHSEEPSQSIDVGLETEETAADRDSLELEL